MFFRRFRNVRQVAGDVVRAGIAGDMIERAHEEPPPPVEDIERLPTPPSRPHDRAQWDEAAGRWIEWDGIDQEWDPVHGAGAGGDGDDAMPTAADPG